MTAEIIALDEHRPHEVGPAYCRACGHGWVAVAPVVRDPGGLECPNCHEHESRFYEADEGGAR